MILFFSLRLSFIFFLISIQTSFASNALDQACEYGMAMIKSRIEYFQSLNEFLTSPENTIDEKFDLLETILTEENMKK